MRNFGYMVNNKPNAAPGAEQITGVRDPVLAKVTNRDFRGFDLDYPDVDRAKVFLDELAEYEKTGNMPRLIVMRLGNDHTSGTAAGKIAPLSAAADNDYALGQMVEGGFEVAVLDQHRDLRSGGRRAERSRPCGFPPLAGLRDFALGEAPRGG